MSNVKQFHVSTVLAKVRPPGHGSYMVRERFMIGPENFTRAVVIVRPGSCMA